MGMYECVWVRWGVGGKGNTKTRHRGGNYGLTGPDLGPMAGEISPNIMFGKKTKNTQMTLDGYMWVRMGAMGHRDMGEQENKRKRDTSCANGIMFCMCAHTTNQSVQGDIQEK